MSEKSTKERNASKTVPAYAKTLVSLSTSLAAMYLENNLEKGRRLEIPSLGIFIDKADESKDKEHKE